MTDLIYTMTQLSELVHSSSSLHVGVIASPDGAHAGGLIPCVALSAVLKVRVRPSRAVDADVAGGGDVGAPVRLGHDSHHCNA